jgi:hypothetical protein
MEIHSCSKAGILIRPYNYQERNSEAVAYRKIEKIKICENFAAIPRWAARCPDLTSGEDVSLLRRSSLRSETFLRLLATELGPHRSVHADKSYDAASVSVVSVLSGQKGGLFNPDFTIE